MNPQLYTAAARTVCFLQFIMHTDRHLHANKLTPYHQLFQSFHMPCCVDNDNKCVYCVQAKKMSLIQAVRGNDLKASTQFLYHPLCTRALHSNDQITRLTSFSFRTTFKVAWNQDAVKLAGSTFVCFLRSFARFHIGTRNFFRVPI